MKIKLITVLYVICLFGLIRADDAVNIYEGNITINVLEGDQDSIAYVVALKTTLQETCSAKKCYLGWVQSYTIQGQKIVLGYQNPDVKIQPIFTFSGNSIDDYSLIYPKDLDTVWSDIIEIWADRFNPFTSISLKSNLRQKNKELFTSQKVQAQDISFSRSDFSRRAKFSSQDIIQDNAQSYNFELDSQQDANINQEENIQPSLSCNVETNLKLKKTQNMADTDIKNIRNIISKNTITSSIKDIQARRAKIDDKSQFYKEDIDQQIDPEINLYEIDKLQVIDNGIKPADLFLKPQNYKYAAPSKDLFFKKVTPYNKLSISNLGLTTVTRDDTLTPTITKTTINKNINLQHEATSVSLINYTKKLYQRTVLGKIVSVSITVNCYLSYQTNGHFVSCLGTLNYILFGKSKSISVFSFKKSIAQTWTFSKTYPGSWSFGFGVPLPPPVSFITIHFSFSISYWISLNAYAKPMSWAYPYKYQARAVLETGVDVDARASVRVIAIEGGVFIKGTVVRVGTDPMVTLSYYWSDKKISIAVSWYFWLAIFQFKWGFFWRYWRLFKGWSGVKIIKQWVISSGYYQTWKIKLDNWQVSY